MKWWTTEILFLFQFNPASEYCFKTKTKEIKWRLLLWYWYWESTLDLTSILPSGGNRFTWCWREREREMLPCYQALKPSISHDCGSGNHVMFAMTLLEVRWNISLWLEGGGWVRGQRIRMMLGHTLISLILFLLLHLSSNQPAVRKQTKYFSQNLSLSWIISLSLSLSLSPVISYFQLEGPESQVSFAGVKLNGG